MINNELKSRVENDNVLVLERIFDAPRDLVFKMFKEPEHLKHWWGPTGWELPVCHIDFRPGGTWHFCMKCTDQNQGEYYGMESWGKVVYKDIVEPEMITYTDYFSDADGNINETMPSSEIKLEFIDLGDGETKLVNHAEYVSAEALQAVMDMGMLQGITETWNRLEERLNKIK
ncbi:SRPBCC domain-containing protein [Gracilibacillus salitolerans]|uniref:SRPBCC domain-containing protein n=1 Tax=Gracilibacillus salitolerans TaxID=2663022 RepID=A0A5Q2TQ06_9BACI|nr:SRPBCC domain-containing protein [Gracilibacillus salitolerans]QGH37099.1 SRPBCC domain-containing protein [Gracilibacillus salitolerans]